MQYSFVYTELANCDSSVGTATRYALEGPGIEYRWRRDFPHPSRPASYTVDTGSHSRG